MAATLLLLETYKLVKFQLNDILDLYSEWDAADCKE